MSTQDDKPNRGRPPPAGTVVQKVVIPPGAVRSPVPPAPGSVLPRSPIRSPIPGSAPRGPITRAAPTRSRFPFTPVPRTPEPEELNGASDEPTIEFVNDEPTRRARPMENAIARAPSGRFETPPEDPVDDPVNDFEAAATRFEPAPTRFEPDAQLLVRARHPDEETPPPESQPLLEDPIAAVREATAAVREFDAPDATRFEGPPRQMEITSPKLFRMEYMGPTRWQRWHHPVRRAIALVFLCAGIVAAAYIGYGQIRSALVPEDTSYVDGGAPI